MSGWDAFDAAEEAGDHKFALEACKCVGATILNDHQREALVGSSEQRAHAINDKGRAGHRYDRDDDERLCRP
ncbi:hypothetical protein ES708_03230 [subsurface metagenome]